MTEPFGGFAAQLIGRSRHTRLLSKETQCLLSDGAPDFAGPELKRARWVP